MGGGFSTVMDRMMRQELDYKSKELEQKEAEVTCEGVESRVIRPYMVIIDLAEVTCDAAG